MIDSFKINKRLGIKIPRSTLLPPYLVLLNPYFVDYTDSMDAVLGPEVDDKINALANIRNMWVQNPDTETSVRSQQIIDKLSWSTPERSIVVQQANMLGMKLEHAGVVSDDAYQTIARYVGIYWFGKGTQDFIQFINFCLTTFFEVINLWTEDYVVFLEEGDTDIGTPVWEGGTWYPTTHVILRAPGGLMGFDIFTLQSFFYEIANYNLVLQSIDASFRMKIVSDQPTETAKVLGLAVFAEYNVVIANF